MEKVKYIVLQSDPQGDPFDENLLLGFDPSAESEPKPLEVHEVELTLAEQKDIKRDPRTRAMAQPMPMRLIKPVAVEAASSPASTGEAWGVQAVRATDSPFDGAEVTIAVLDTGIDPGHPAFKGVDIVQKNFTSESDDDLHGHGTHCAGTIFGQDENGFRIGIARNIERALIGKVLGKGGGSSADIVHAINWAVKEGAQVISMSLGIDFPGFVDRLVVERGININPATSLALEAYRANINLFTTLADFVSSQGFFGLGAVLIAAAGNESNRPEYEIAVSPPAAGTGIISIGALGQGTAGLKVAAFSNNQVDVSAPGVRIKSAKPGGGYTRMNGTSMATPHVAGVAALWAQRQLQHSGEINLEALKAQIIASGTTDPLAINVEAEDVGTGIVQAPLH